MPNTILPNSLYPTALDTDTNLFAVYNTSESALTQTLNSWDTTITIYPVSVGKPEIWANNGYITIEGELIYYRNVNVNGNNRVYQFTNCIRRVNGTPPRSFLGGTPVRGFVVAEHHNNLAGALINIERFIGITDTTDQDTITWKLQTINNLAPLTDDAGCPQIEFYYIVTSESPITGTTISYNLNVIGTYDGFSIDFGDGTSESATPVGTHSYAPNKPVDPVVTVTSTYCDTLQTSAQRVRIKDIQNTPVVNTTFPIVVPTIPDFPNFDLAVVNPVANNIQFPPIVMPCLDIGPFGPIVVPSTISIINPYPIPSVIAFTNVPVFPSTIAIVNNGVIPSTISIIGTLPSTINVNSNIPSVITVQPNTISLIGPSNINFNVSVVGIPSVIQVAPIDISIALTGDYCSVCTNQIACNAPQTVGGNTGVGCSQCPGTIYTINKVTCTIHDFFVQTFTGQQYSRYDLVKLLLVGPDGNNCLLMGGAGSDATQTPQYVMQEPVTITFDDASSNNIYDFNQQLKSQSYYPNANGNNLTRNAGQVTLNPPAPAPGGFNGYGTSLAVFADTNLKSGPWSIYMAVGPNAATYQNLAYLGTACAKITSNKDSGCIDPTPPPTPSGKTPAPTKGPTATPRRTNPPVPSASVPPATPNPSNPNFTLPYNFTPAPDIGPIRPEPNIPPRPQPTSKPAPTKKPKPTAPPAPTANCGTCTYSPNLEDCGQGVCTYFWNFTTNSWGRCVECTSCSTAGENCDCPDASLMVTYGKLPADGSTEPTKNTNCYRVVWSADSLLECDGFCTYSFNPTTKEWSLCDECWFCKGTEAGCDCLDPQKLIAAGILVEDPGTNATEHTMCYYEVVDSTCKEGSCECPPAPTPQVIESSSQTIQLPCQPDCGECWDVWEYALDNPCNPNPGDYMCAYIYEGGGWTFDVVQSTCPCENMQCLSSGDAQFLLPQKFPAAPSMGERVYLSCYGGAFINYDGCNPEASPLCNCPPTPTPAPSNRVPDATFIVGSCTRPSPTPSPTAGCGFCNYLYECQDCAEDGGCLYEYMSSGKWRFDNLLVNKQTCGCLTIEEALLVGLIPEVPAEGAQKIYDLSGYITTPSGEFVGTWNFIDSDCQSSLNCVCPNTTPSSPGSFPDQPWSIGCIRPTPTPTPQPSGNCFGNCFANWASSCGGSCVYKQVAGVWSFDYSILVTPPCECPSVSQVATSLAYFGSSPGGSLPAINPSTSPNDGFWFFSGGCYEPLFCRCVTPQAPYPQTAFRGPVPCEPKPSATPTPTPCGPTPSPTMSPTPSPSIGNCTNCSIQWDVNAYKYNVSFNGCTSPECGGCYIPSSYQGQSLTVPCLNSAPQDKCTASNKDNWPKYCTWECRPEYGPAGWFLVSPCSAGCDCTFPAFNYCDQFSDKYVYQFCNFSPIVNFSLGDNSYIVDNSIENPEEKTQSVPKVQIVSATKERIKLCKHAGKKPLEMVKAGCGSCAIRTCDKYGLCSHTGVIEGRDDVLCCQLCDDYERDVNITTNNQVTNTSSVPTSVKSEAISSNDVSQLTNLGTKSESIPSIQDPIDMASDEIKLRNQVKIVPTDSAIKVDVNSLLEGQTKKNEAK